MDDVDSIADNTEGGISIWPKSVYGLRTDILYNVHFTLEQEVIYPVEGVVAIHDYNNKTQKFLRLAEGVSPLALVLSPSRKLLAVLEDNGNNYTQISIYDLSTLLQRRVLVLPKHPKQGPVIAMAFTPDSKAIALLTKYPDEWLFILSLDATGTIYEGRPSQTLGYRTVINCMACHPADKTITAVAGDSVFLFMAQSEKGFTIANNFKINFNITTMAFTSGDLLWLGTDDNELIMVESTDVKLRQQADIADAIDIMWDQEALDREIRSKFWLSPEELIDTRVVCMTTYSRGFVFAIFNRVYVFEKVNKFRFERKMVLTVQINYYEHLLFQIENLAIDHKEETVIVSTKHSQIYQAKLIIPEGTRSKMFNFKPLGSLLHIDAVVHVSVCAWKPILMTASRDQTIRIWNYETETTELVRKFQVDINIAELNATGLFAAIGFTDQLRIAQIFMDELNIVKTYNFPRCKCIKYSNLGHYMGVAYDNMIVITSVCTLQILKYLKGHNGLVLSLCWSKGDRYLISGGADGAIYQWDAEAGVRVQEIVQKGTEYRCICCTMNEPLSIYAATNHGVMREFQKSEIVREVVLASNKKCALVDMCLARSDLIMFISNECGDLFNVKLPFIEAGGGGVTQFRFFISCINKIVFSYDGTLLIAVSDSGTLSTWALQNIEGKVADMDPDLLHSQEVLIPRSLLKEKIEQIATLELRLKQQAEEFQYQLSQNEIFDGQQMAEVHQRYISALEDLKQKNSVMEELHVQKMNSFTFQINVIKKENHKQIETLSNQFSDRLLEEYHKYKNLRESMLQLRENYENRLKKSAGNLQSTVEGLESNYKNQLDERKELIRKLLEEMGDKKIEFIEFCRQVEDENNRTIAELQLKYENKLNNERKATKMWRGRAGGLQKKYETLSKNIESIVEEVETLKEEQVKSQKTIAKLNRDIEDLLKDISDRDFVISAKENRIQELQRKNMELDKHKSVLTHKIADLKAQIEPIEFQINDKRKKIFELENQLELLNQDNMHLERQLKEMRDRYIHNMGELRDVKHRSKAARKCIYEICSEIYSVAGKIHKPKEMMSAVKIMLERHSTDNDLKRYVQIDAQVREEFERQRAYIQTVLESYHHDYADKVIKEQHEKLLNENVTILKEIEQLRNDNKNLLMQINKMIQQNIIDTFKKKQRRKK